MHCAYVIDCERNYTWLYSYQSIFNSDPVVRIAASCITSLVDPSCPVRVDLTWYLHSSDKKVSYSTQVLKLRSCIHRSLFVVNVTEGAKRTFGAGPSNESRLGKISNFQPTSRRNGRISKKCKIGQRLAYYTGWTKKTGPLCYIASNFGNTAQIYTMIFCKNQSPFNLNTKT